jgi:hypothetical protein
MSWQNFWAKNFNFSFYSGSIFEDLLENNTLSEKMVALYFQNGKFEVSSEVLLNLRDDYNYVLLSLASDEFENHIKGQLKETPMAESGENHWFDYALKNEVNLKFDLSDLDQSVIFSQSLGKNEMVASVDLVNENDSGQIGIDRPSDLLNIAEDVFDELAFPDGFEETKIEFEVNEFGNVVLVKNFEIQLNQEELLQGLNGLLLDGFALPDEAVAVNEDNPVFLNGLALKGNLIGEIIIEEKERQLEMSLVVNLPKQGQRVKDGLALNFNANLIDFGALPSIFEQDAIMQETFVIVDALEGSSFVHERGYAVGDRLSDYENYLLSDEFVKNIAGFLRDEPYQNCEEDCFIEFRFKNGLRLSFQFSKDSGEIYVKETLLEDRFFSELNVTDSNEKLVIVETPIDFFGSEINPFIVDLETIPIVVDSTKIMLEEFDKTNLIQFWHTDVRDATMLITAFVDAFGVPTGEEVSSLENKLVNEGEVELDFIVAGEIEDVDFHVFIMEIENGFEGTVFYQDQMHPESFALMVEKNFNDELIPFGDYSNLFEKDETVREEMSFYFDKEESWSFESVKLYMLGGDYSIYADYFTLDKFVSELETMGATHFETWFDEGQRVIHYMLFGVDVSVQLNDDMQEITFREQVIRPVKAIGEYVTPVFSLEGLGFACFENEDASGHCGTNLTIAPLYLNLQFNQEGACSEVEISNQGDLILGKYDFFHVIYDIRLDKTFYELGRDVDGSFKLSEFWVSADGEITPAEDGKELKIFKNEFEFMVGEEMEGAMAELTRFLEEIPVQEWGMDYLPLADLPMR